MLHLKSIKKRPGNPKIIVSLLVLSFIISSAGVFPVLGDTGHTWSITVDKINGNPSPFTILTNPIHLNGTISSTNFVGDISQYQVQINWGDGTVDQDSNIQITPVGSNFIGTWSTNPDHNYATNGAYTTTVKLYHSQPPGAEASGDATYTVTYSVIVGVNVNTSPTGLDSHSGRQNLCSPIPNQLGSRISTHYIHNRNSTRCTRHKIPLERLE